MLDLPLAYLITFRSYGTWLHGDDRGSVDRFHNQYGAPLFPQNEARRIQNQLALRHSPVIFNSEQRQSVEQAIRQTCELRKWTLRAVNARTNHIHSVVSTAVRPELALNALKANATRQLRQAGHWDAARSPWSDGGSRRYIWTEVGVERAIDYVLNGQDEKIPELDPPKRNQNHLRWRVAQLVLALQLPLQLQLQLQLLPTPPQPQPQPQNHHPLPQAVLYSF